MLVGFVFFHDIHDSDLIPGFGEIKSFDGLFEEAHRNKRTTNATHLTPVNRILWHMIVHCIIPQQGSLNAMNQTGLCILYCLVNKIKINLPNIIIRHMLHIREKSRNAYAYGMLITRFAQTEYKSRVPTPLIKDCRQFCLNWLFHQHEGGSWSRNSPGSSKRSRSDSDSSFAVLGTSTQWTTPSSSSQPSSSAAASQMPSSSTQAIPTTATTTTPSAVPPFHFSQHTPMSAPPAAPSVPPSDDPYIPAPPPTQPPPSNMHETRVNSILLAQMHRLQFLIRRVEIKMDENFMRFQQQLDNMHGRINMSAHQIHASLERQHNQMDDYANYIGQSLNVFENTQRLMGQQLVTLNQRIQRLDDQFAVHFGMPPIPTYNGGMDGFSRESYDAFGLNPPTSNGH